MSAFARVFTQSASVLISRPQHICPSPGCVMTSDSSPALPAPPLHCFLFSLFSEDDLLWPCLSPGTHSLSPIDVCYTMPAPALVTLPPQLSSVSLGPSQTGVRGSPRRQLSVDCRAVNISGTRATASSGMDENDGSMTRISRGDQ